MTGGDIFEQLAQEMDTAPEPSPLSGVLAPEIIKALDPQTLALALGGVYTAVAKTHHPDVIIGAHPDEDIQTLARNNHQDGEPSEVSTLRKRALAGAAVVNDFKLRVEKAKADPLSAKLGALQTARRSPKATPGTGAVGRRRGQSIKTPAVATTTSTESEQPPTVSEERQRMALDLLASPESLTNIGNARVLCATGPTSAVLFDVWGKSADTNHTPEITGRELSLLVPDARRVNAWETEGFKRYNEVLHGRILLRSEVNVVSNGGIRLAFEPPLDGQNRHLGREAANEVFDKLNQGGDHKFNPSIYQLGILNDDGQYEFMPTVQGFTSYIIGNVCLKTGAFDDWLLSVYGTLPDVVYVVNEGDDTQDRRTLYAYEATSDTIDLLNPHIIVGESVVITSAYDLSLLGFAHNISRYRASGPSDNKVLSLTPGEETGVAAGALLPLKDNADIVLRSGATGDFSPVQTFHEKPSGTPRPNELGVVVRFAHTQYDDVDGLSDHEPNGDLDLETPHTYALANPVAIGVTASAINTNSTYERLRKAHNRAALMDGLGNTISDSLAPLIRSAVQAALDEM